MTEQQTAATDNALLEQMREIAAMLFEDAPVRSFQVDAAAERIKSLLAEVERLTDKLVSCDAKLEKAIIHALRLEDISTQKHADRQRMREALERARPYVSSAALQYISVGIDADLRAVDTALNPASKEANDG